MLSCIIPVLNEKENVAQLTGEIIAVCHQLNTQFEIIFVDDGSTDGTYDELVRLHKKFPKIIKIIRFRTNFGKSAAYDAAFTASEGEITATLDGDGQDDPKELKRMIVKLNEGYDMVTGWRQIRKDNFIKSSTSLLFNGITRFFSHVKLHDFNCGLKVYSRKAIKSLHLYGELHRYIPVLLSSNGYKVTEVQVSHRKRLYGKTKYGPIRFINGFLDLFTVISITRFRSRPMHFFGYIGSIIFGIGFLFGLYLVSLKIFFGQAIGERPLLSLSVLLMIMGVQVGITGLVGEYITMTVTPNRPSYDIDTIVEHE
jgi:glycosyltransferase involved in cell wall biosynthesis